MYLYVHVCIFFEVDGGGGPGSLPAVGVFFSQCNAELAAEVRRSDDAAFDRLYFEKIGWMEAWIGPLSISDLTTARTHATPPPHKGPRRQQRAWDSGAGDSTLRRLRF